MKANLFFLIAFVYQITCQVEEDINAQLDPLEKDKIMTCAEMVSRKFQTESVLRTFNLIENC